LIKKCRWKVGDTIGGYPRCVMTNQPVGCIGEGHFFGYNVALTNQCYNLACSGSPLVRMREWLYFDPMNEPIPKIIVIILCAKFLHVWWHLEILANLSLAMSRDVASVWLSLGYGVTKQKCCCYTVSVTLAQKLHHHHPR
jgi:hypothetical protein